MEKAAAAQDGHLKEAIKGQTRYLVRRMRTSFRPKVVATFLAVFAVVALLYSGKVVGGPHTFSSNVPAYISMHMQKPVLLRVQMQPTRRDEDAEATQLVQDDNINGADQAEDAYRAAVERAAGEAAEPEQGQNEREQQEEEEQNTCEDNDKLLTETFVPGIESGIACAEALGYVGCGVKTEAGLLSELCPLSCDSCPTIEHVAALKGMASPDQYDFTGKLGRCGTNFGGQVCLCEGADQYCRWVHSPCMHTAPLARAKPPSSTYPPTQNT